MKKKVVYYKDILKDDFSNTRIKQKPLKDNFKYINRRPLWNLIGWFLYYFIAVPIAFFFCKAKLRHRFKNKKVLRKNLFKGYFLFCNHTQLAADAFLPALAVYPKRNYILINKDGVSIFGIKEVVMMLGGIPVATSLNNMKGMVECINKRIKQKHVVTIYPEATIWPYNTKIRPFPDSSFRYAVDLNAPVYSQTLVYRKRKGFTRLFTRRPFATLYIDGPFYPDKTLDKKQAIKKLRDQVYNAMNQRASTEGNYEYVKYLPKNEINNE